METRPSACLVSSDIGLGERVSPRGKDGINGQMDLRPVIIVVFSKMLFSNMYIYLFLPTKLLHLVLNRSFSPIFCSNYRYTRLKLHSLN